MKHVCKKPYRQGKHLREAMDFLRRLGATAIEVLHNKHLHLAWEYRGTPFVIPMTPSSKARSGAASVMRSICQKMRRAGIVVPSLGAVA